MHCPILPLIPRGHADSGGGNREAVGGGLPEESAESGLVKDQFGDRGDEGQLLRRCFRCRLENGPSAVAPELSHRRVEAGHFPGLPSILHRLRDLEQLRAKERSDDLNALRRGLPVDLRSSVLNEGEPHAVEG